MASKLKKLSLGLDIDGSLTSEGAECELSLADDGDGLTDSFSGMLTFDGVKTPTPSKEKARGWLITTTDETETEEDVVTYCVPSSPAKTALTRVTFEIVNARVLREGRSRYVAYTILAVRSPGADSSQAMVERRYSDFEKLHNCLRRAYPSLMHDIVFPRKMLTGNYRAETIAQRSRAFEQYLSHIFSLDMLKYSSEIADFFYGHDITEARSLLEKGEYRTAIPILQRSASLQQKLLGDNHQSAALTLCALVAVLSITEQEELAQNFSEVALACLGNNEKSPLLLPLLETSIRLCWKLGKDKKDLEQRQRHLVNKGLTIDSGHYDLLDTVMHYLAKQ